MSVNSKRSKVVWWPEYKDQTVVDGPQKIAECSFALNAEERIKNTRLIAAAPELLEALQLWIDYDNMDEADFSGVSPMLLYATAINATRDAIAKATQ